MRALLVALAVALTACPATSGNDGGDLTPPPQAFLTLVEPNVIDTALRGTVNVTGCATVAQVQLLQGGAFLTNVPWLGSATTFTLPPGTFAGLYGTLGLAAKLSLSVKVVCDDGRTNTSQPIGAEFFPVASRLSLGVQALPDAFVAEGGLGGLAVTFLGCVGSSTGTQLARADTRGTVIGTNPAIACDASAVISERSAVTGTRWVMQPGKGAWAIAGDLTVLKTITGKIDRMGVAANGTAILWDSTLATEQLIKADPVASGASDWSIPLTGIMNADPIVDVGNRAVWVSTWHYDSGAATGDIVIAKYQLDTGALLNGLGAGGPPVLIHQVFDVIDTPLQGKGPQGAFNTDGSLYFAPLLSKDTSGVVHTSILGCATVGSCDGAGRKFATDPPFDGVVNLVLPFSAGNLLAAVGPFQAWFLSPGGTVLNLGGAAVRPTGSLQILGVQAGLGTDFYLLDGPVVTTGAAWPTEAVAVDVPQNGELWRFGFGAGLAGPLDGLTMGIDDLGQSWFRVGTDQVKPLSLTEYRMARGPTVSP
jgi:hypothetical protein